MFGKALCKLRGLAFWRLDSVKGNSVRNAYNKIKEIDHIDSRSDRVIKYQENALNKLIVHATDTTDFYKPFKGAVLKDFPVIDKHLINEHKKEFMSNIYNKNNLIAMSTSGSTGTPFICYQNKEKKKRVNAEVIYYSEKAGYSVGKNLIFLRALTEKSKKTKIHQWIQNESLIDISHLDNKNIEGILGEIEKASSSGSMILAYASTLDVLKDYFKRNGNSKIGESNITGIVSSSEMLFDDTRDSISKAFNCQCFSRYSNQENGIIGQDDRINNAFLLNEANYLVEIFKENEDTPVSEGEVGRIVITDLYNYAMPLIRYDTGDIGTTTFVNYNGIQKRAISNFGGRKIDIVYDCYGNRLSPHIISNNFWSFPEIKQFQFIQETSNQYTIKICADRKLVKENELKDILFNLLGKKAQIKLELVDQIPVLSSGKRKYVINRMNG
ncbi:phenylacetate--CoA ligase family protein [Cerasibacillus terrae]|uniref:Phenylacetate--CoA ligase family protein n=1 Tax=Cerasibacillus terrae TaxID=2498845 RepID=A0A5C8NZK9_9BACI|nr:phenylacetate--CoA ligase family protein [Cerasibacillus terrae]TXL66768.1 phenylacetate--CoA ligase family protein [Cerasibacillus terrae]